MRYEIIYLSDAKHQSGAALYAYILDPSEELAVNCRPMVVVCPGGAYGKTSDREAELVALQFCAMGCHAAVLRYSVAPEARYPAALLELGKSIAAIRDHASRWNVDPQKIAVAGFSAGGHLAANYCMFWKRDWVAETLETDTSVLQPNAMILGYPVITAGEYAHHGSFHNLLGDRYEELKDELSLECQVNRDVPPAFIWHTFEDAAVPVQNSIMLVEALAAQRIPVEFHLFPTGGHGLSLGNWLTQGRSGFGVEPSCASWIGLVRVWLEHWRLDA